VTEDSFSGVLIVDKPEGPTSHDVVDRLRRLFGMKRVGHAGTLDPMATGVLIIGLGKATRLLNFLKDLPKRYSAQIQFGISTTTQDAMGEVEKERSCSFSEEDLRQVAAGFVGEIEQVPPMVSAVRVGGKRLYESARDGVEVERRPRKVRVHSLEFLEIDLEKWEASIDVLCSSGTYIRTLASDLGELLGCGAHLSALRRTSIGSFTDAESSTLDSLEALDPDERQSFFLPMADAMRDFPIFEVSGELEKSVRHGRALDIEAPPVRRSELPTVIQPRTGQVPPHQAGMTVGIPVAVVGNNGELLAVYRRFRGGLKPAAVLV
jgi:tRNA pseudouridine55 synthase